MKVRYYIDPYSEFTHIHNHEVSEEEYVLSNPVEDRPGKSGSRVAIGQTESGHYLRVIYVPDQNKKSLFVITAYDLRDKPLLAFRKRMKRRQQR